jgi:hypothetical protein
VIGHDYAGVVQRDGWHSYRYLKAAAHQTCLAHLLRRCRGLLLDQPHQPWVRAVKAVLQAAVATHAAHQTGAVSAHGLDVARGHYVERLGRLLARRPSRDRRIRLFHQHLVVEFEADRQNRSPVSAHSPFN